MFNVVLKLANDSYESHNDGIICGKYNTINEAFQFISYMRLNLVSAVDFTIVENKNKEK